MDLITIFIIAVSLSIDSFAASIVLGANSKQVSIFNIIKVALIFGFFQAVMPIFGWSVGNKFEYIIKSIDHWIAFVLLLLVGGKMIYESLSKSKKNNSNIDISNFYLIITLGISTSIDAMVIGISFGVLRIAIQTPIIIIGITTFIFSTTGVILGKKVGIKFGNKFEVIGGVVLILLGVKILIEHLFIN